jgi:ATP-dependent RNA helicase DDX21
MSEPIPVCGLLLLLLQIGDPTEALALALAKITGNTGMKARSLLTAHDDVTTLHFK